MKYIVKLGPIAMPDGMANSGDVIELLDNDAKALVQFGMVEAYLVRDEPTRVAIEEEPTPSPSKEEPTPSPSTEEPTPSPSTEEPTPSPSTEEPTPSPSKEGSKRGKQVVSADVS